MTISIVASLLAGLGLFFVGMQFITEHLKLLSSRRMRRHIAGWTRNPFGGLAVGGLMAGLTQSTIATIFILVSMVRSGLMPVRQALPIAIGAHMLIGLVVLVLVFDVRTASFFVLGISGLLYTSKSAREWRQVTGAMFGIGMLFLGLETMELGVAPLAESAWLENVVALTEGSYFLGLVLGILVSLVLNSTLAVTVLTIALERAGLFTLPEAIMLVYGANLGSSLRSWVYASKLSGESGQMKLFKIGYGFVGVFLLLPLFYLEVYAGIPSVMAAVEALTSDSGMQIAVANLIFNAVPGVLLFLLRNPVVGLLQRISPRTGIEKASRPAYMHERATDDPVSALDLIELEQLRLIDLLSESFSAMRDEAQQTRLPELQEAFRSLGRFVHEAIVELSNRHLLSGEAYDSLNRLLNLQRLLEDANDAMGNLGQELGLLRSESLGSRFSWAAVEGLDAILFTLKDVAYYRTGDDANLLEMMTSEDGNGLHSVRSAYLKEESGLDTRGRMMLLSAANHCERLILLFGQMGRQYMALKAA